MPRRIVELLACPSCRWKLVLSSDALLCPNCGRSYPVQEGVPRLLLEQKWMMETPPSGLAGRLIAATVARPSVYDLAQRIAGAKRIFRRIRPVLAEASGAVVLDAGAGTGTLEGLLPRSARYVWLDPDPRKLRGFSGKSNSPAVVADATRLPFGDQSVDWVVSTFVSHHLDDAQLELMLEELRRVARQRLVLLDAVLAPTMRSRLLWRYDRGRHPRTAAELRRKLGTRFRIESDEEFTILHRYLLVTGT